MESEISDQPMDLDNEAQKVETDNVGQKMWGERKRMSSVNVHWDAIMQHAESSRQLDEV